MSGGGGGTTTSYTSNLPEYAEPYFIDMMDRAQNASMQPYTPYTGDRIADLSEGQTGAYDLASSLGQPSQIGTATDMTTDAALSSLNNTGTFTNNNVTTPTGWNSDVANRYMDPFADKVTDAAVQKLTSQYLTQQGARDANAAKLGAFGGSRQALVENAAMNDYNQNVTNTVYQGLSDAYKNAQNVYGTDTQALLSAEKANQDAAAQAAQIRQAGYTGAMSGAQQLGALGATEQELALNRAGALDTYGKEQQAYEQSLLDQQYNDFTNERDAERNALTFYSGILRGTNGVIGQDTTATAGSGSAASSLAGLGLAGYGLSTMSGTK